jgi:Type VI secretion system/phage-baseplate injector OB domain
MTYGIVPDRQQRTYWGKYRGTVIDNADPMVSARLLCQVPSLPGGQLNWATPCVPYAALEQGFLSVPPVGANVWIEFEGGNLDHPIWTGCFWESAEIPVMPELSPEQPDAIKVFSSKYCTLIYNDLPVDGGITVQASDPAVDVPIMITLNSTGVSISVGDLSLLMNPEEGITLQAGETVAVLSAETGVSIEAPAVSVTAETVTVTAETSFVGDTDVAGAFDVAGITTLEPEANVTGDLNVTAECSVEGDLNVAGALTVEGESNFLGLATYEGETNFLGAVTAEGDMAVLGAVEVAVTTACPLFLGEILPPPPPLV